MFDFWQDGFENTLEKNENCGRWLDIVTVMLPEVTSWEIAFENILSMSVWND